MKKESKISKDNLEKLLVLINEILTIIPKNDSMHETFKKLSEFTKERIDTYEQFINNPYKSTASQVKLNSDSSLNLGEYIEWDE